MAIKPMRNTELKTRRTDLWHLLTDKKPR